MKVQLIFVFVTLISFSYTNANGYYRSEAKETGGIDSLKVGAAVIDITPVPNLNIELSGYKPRGFSEKR